MGVPYGCMEACIALAEVLHHGSSRDARQAVVLRVELLRWCRIIVWWKFVAD